MISGGLGARKRNLSVTSGGLSVRPFTSSLPHPPNSPLNSSAFPTLINQVSPAQVFHQSILIFKGPRLVGKNSFHSACISQHTFPPFTHMQVLKHCRSVRYCLVSLHSVQKCEIPKKLVFSMLSIMPKILHRFLSNCGAWPANSKTAEKGREPSPPK